MQNAQAQGHWHYVDLYFAQNLYYDDGDAWKTYHDKIATQPAAAANEDGSWKQGFIGPVYTTAINLTILQLEKAAVPLYRRKP